MGGNGGLSSSSPLPLPLAPSHELLTSASAHARSCECVFVCNEATAGGKCFHKQQTRQQQRGRTTFIKWKKENRTNGGKLQS